MVMHFDSCCCGCSLKTGTVIIAILSILSAITNLTYGIIGSQATAEVTTTTTTPNLVDYGFKANMEDATLTTTTTTSSSSGTTAIRVLNIISAIASFFLLIFSLMMLFGASSGRAALLKPWIILSIIYLVVEDIVYVGIIIFLFTAEAFIFGVVILVIILVATCLHVYFILVVNSYHTECMGVRIPVKA